MRPRLGKLRQVHGNNLYPLLEELGSCELALSHVDFHRHYGGDNLKRGQRTDDVVTIRGAPHLTLCTCVAAAVKPRQQRKSK